jgi:hypothetical protein
LDLDHELRALCRALDEAAPPVSIAEITGHREVSPRHAAPSTGRVTGSGRRRRWQVAGVAIGLVAASVLAGLAFLGDRDRVRTTPNAPSQSTVGPPPSVVPSTVGGGSTTLTAASTVPVTAAPTTTSPPAGPSLPSLQRQVGQALSNVDSFRATATITRGGADATTQSNTVTLLSDGRMWALTDGGGWASYDPSTGVSKLMSIGPDGTATYQEIVGWADNSVGIQILVGHDPVMRFERGAAEADISEVVHDGRPAWQITSAADVNRPGQFGGQVEVFVIDQATGLVVATRTELAVDGAVQVTESSLTGLETGVTLPAEYPGVFPDGAAVERSGDPNAFQLTTLDDAAAFFGRGFVAPADLPAGTRVTTSAGPVMAETGETFATNLTVTITIPDGFARSTVELHKFVPIGDVAPGFGMIPIDDALCFSTDGITCTRTADTDVVTAGALAGHNLHVEGDGTVINVDTGPVSAVVIAMSPEAALNLVNSFIDLSPTSE